jgi:hypothetical protein
MGFSLMMPSPRSVRLAEAASVFQGADVAVDKMVNAHLDYRSLTGVFSFLSPRMASCLQRENSTHLCPLSALSTLSLQSLFFSLLFGLRQIVLR